MQKQSETEAAGEMLGWEVAAGVRGEEACEATGFDGCRAKPSATGDRRNFASKKR